MDVVSYVKRLMSYNGGVQSMPGGPKVVAVPKALLQVLVTLVLTCLLVLVTYWRLSDKIDALTIDKARSDGALEVSEQWRNSELRRIDNQNKINYELYRQALENDKQILGFIQGRQGKLLLEISEPPPPAQ